MLVGKLEKPFETSKKKLPAERRRDIAIKTIPRLIPLVMKLGMFYLSFKRKAKKAGKIFEKELVANGIDRTTARLLTEEYLKTSHFLRQFDFSHMVRE